MARGQGVLPPLDLLGGTQQLNAITVDDVYTYVNAWITYFYTEYDMYAQWTASNKGPYLSGHIRSTPVNPAGPSISELVGQTAPGTPTGIGMYGYGPTGVTVPPLADKRAALYNNSVNQINAQKIFEVVQDILQKQAIISYTIHKYTVYGDGGNKGYYNPSTYSSTKNLTVFYNQVHRTRWNAGAFSLTRDTPYGNPLEDPERTTAPDNLKAWQVALVYGTNNFNSRPDLFAGNQPVNAREMEVLYVPQSFPQTIPPSSTTPWGTSAPWMGPYPPSLAMTSPQYRDIRVVQPRVKRWNNARDRFKTTDDVIFKQDLASYLSDIVYDWWQGDYKSATMFEWIVCHASCHGSCHGSRGRR